MRLAPKPNAFEFVPIRDLRSHPLFKTLPYKYLEYHDRTVVRRLFKEGDIVCEEGDYGATAFLIIAGEFEIVIDAPKTIEIEDEPTADRIKPESVHPRILRTLIRDEATADLPPVGASSPLPRPRVIRTREDVIIGEMSCLSHHPRTATIKALSDSCEIWEIRRNFLDALRRNRGSRAILEKFYEERAIPDLLRRAELFAKLPEADRDAIVAYLRPRVALVRVDAGRTVFEEGQAADHFYLVRLGFVKVARKANEGEIVLDYLGPNTQFGEIGLLTATTSEYVKDDVKSILPAGFTRGTRTATISALDDVELVRIRGEDFHALAEKYESFRNVVFQKAEEYLEKNAETLKDMATHLLADAAEQGLYNANSLLVLDLEKCTRCDECTKACSDAHGGVSRLTREGLRFDNFLIATSCRSCQNPYCLAGCPVDAIHRRPPSDKQSGLEIVIEPWCIGCGRCAQNCPYGNINMHEYLEQAPRSSDGTLRLKSRAKLAARVKLAIRKILARFDSRFQVKQKVRVRAVTCDLCRDLSLEKGHEVACVHACPHDAAHRIDGPTLINLVRGRSPH